MNESIKEMQPEWGISIPEMTYKISIKCVRCSNPLNSFVEFKDQFEVSVEPCEFCSDAWEEPL